MIGDRDRAEAALTRGLEQRLDRGRAVGGVIGVHVQVDMDRRATDDSRADLRVAAGIVATRADPPVDLLDLVGGGAPVAGRAGGRTGELAAQRRARKQSLELARQGDRVTGLEEQADLTVVGELVVDRQLRADRHRRRGEGAADQSRGRTRAARRGDEDVGRGDQRLRGALRGANDPDALAQAL